MSMMDDSMPKRSVNIVFYEIEKSDLYPEGKLFSIRMVRIKRSGDTERMVVATEKLSKALDIAEYFLETGVVSCEYSPT